MDYASLVSELEAVIAADNPAYSAAVASTAHLPAFPGRSIFIHEVAKPIQQFLGTQDEFSSSELQVLVDSGSNGFDASGVATRLVDKAIEQSPEVAVDWLRAVLKTKSAKGTLISLVWGLRYSPGIQLPEGLRLVSLEDLPESDTKEKVLNRVISIDVLAASPAAISTPPEAAIVYEQNYNPVLWNLNDGEVPTRASNHHLIQMVIRALSILSSEPLVEAARWFQYEDSDLNDAMFFSGIYHQMHEIVPFHYTVGNLLDSASASSVVSSFFKADGGFKDRLEISITRFNQAMLRHRAGDKAVELSTALEALLVDDPGEHTYKIGLRAALVVGGDLDSRLRNRATVGGIYRLRSSLMHSGHISQTVKLVGEGRVASAEVAERATEVVRSVIKTIVEAGEIPNWYELELGDEAK